MFQYRSLLKRIYFTAILLLISVFAFSQGTKISGKVTDVLTNEPIPFAGVVFKGTNIGTNTDMDGKFVLETNTPTDSVVITTIGYTAVKMRVKPGQTQTINVVLKATKFELKEVTINAGENPANIIFRKIVKHKDDNDPSKLHTYQFEDYNKLEFDLTNITEKFKNQKLLKPFKFIWDDIDSVETNSKPFLPFFISETMSDVYFKDNPKNKKEIIKGSKVSGLENASVTQFLGDMYQRVDIYSNFIDLFGKGLISPVSDFGLLYYHYYLLDSTFIGNNWCYKLKFKPRRPQELTFTGEFWVADTTWAIKKINMRVSSDANINFVEDLAVVQEYQHVNDEHWMLSKDQLVVDFAARENGLGFIGRKTTSYRKFKLNEAIDDTVFKGAENIEVQDGAMEKKDEYWNENRHDSLSDREREIYHLVDTIKKVPAFKTYVDIITLFFTGYKDIGKIELGPYYTFYSFNEIEGSRFRIGARTSDDFSTKFLADGYLAYGIKDERFKYALNLRYKFSDKPRQFIGASYKFDVQQLGQSDNAFQDDNILSSLFRRSPATKLNTIENEKAFYDVEWVSGFSSRITLSHSHFVPLGDLDFGYSQNTDTSQFLNSFTTSEVSIFSRFAYREKFVSGKIDRVSLGSDYPIIQANLTFGLKDILNSNFNYQKLDIKIDDRLKLAPFGYTYWVLSFGKTWGKVPYPLLELHPGNETYFYDYAAFNLMNYFEFVSDYYVSGYATHHFDGFFFDKVPLFRKLKWREVVQAKAVYGSIGKENSELINGKDLFNPLNKKPYVEVGAGIENILKIFRVDFLWRLSYLENKDVANFGIRGSFQLTF